MDIFIAHISSTQGYTGFATLPLLGITPFKEFLPLGTNLTLRWRVANVD